ncbi:MAG: type II toxin-antitoxin system PemK/MazF family toxin [Mariprofundaceae bacterium]|nr:type II toxin-antitoxin system PemK/MazF family toxin [Mariprofundaceae bacterium]
MVKQYDVYLVNLDPTLGSKIQKTRPCLLISPDEMNANLRTVQIAPMTSNRRIYPWRVAIQFQNKKSSIAVDQIRTIDKRRIVKHLGSIAKGSIKEVKQILQQMLVD